MIQINYESNPGITVDEAYDAVKDMLSVNDDLSDNLFEDYIEASEAGVSDASEYDTLHKFAQLTARSLGDSLDKNAIKTDLTDSNVRYRIEVIDSNYYYTVHNWTNFGYQSFTLD